MSDFDRTFEMLKKAYEYGVYTLEITKDNKKLFLVMAYNIFMIKMGIFCT